MTALSRLFGATPVRPMFGRTDDFGADTALPSAFQTMLASQTAEPSTTTPAEAVTTPVVPVPADTIASDLVAMSLLPPPCPNTSAPLAEPTISHADVSAVTARTPPSVGKPALRSRDFRSVDSAKRMAPDEPFDDVTQALPAGPAPSVPPPLILAVPAAPRSPVALLLAAAPRPVSDAPAGVDRPQGDRAANVDIVISAKSEPAISAVSIAIATRDAGFSIASALPAAPDIAVSRHLDLARGDAWLDDLARDIAGAAGRSNRLNFALAPETFGRLDVEIRRGETGVSIHMAAQSATARDILSAAQPRLIDEIRAQGVRISAAEIAADTSGFGGESARHTPRSPEVPVIEARHAERPADRRAARKSPAVGRYA